MREYLKKNQPIFYNLINNEFSQEKIPHAFLLVGNNTEKPLNFLAMSLICDETLACMKLYIIHIYEPTILMSI